MLFASMLQEMKMIHGAPSADNGGFLHQQPIKENHKAKNILWKNYQ